MLATSTSPASVLAYSAFLALLSSVQATFTVTAPTASSVWALDSPATVSWTSNDASDPSTFGVHLINADGTAMYSIGDDVMECEQSLSLVLDGVPPEEGYLIGLMMNSTVLASSAPFSITAGNATIGPAIGPASNETLIATGYTAQPTAASVSKSRHHGHTAKHSSKFITSTRPDASASATAPAVSSSAITAITDTASSGVPTTTEAAVTETVLSVSSSATPVTSGKPAASPISDILPAPSSAASSTPVGSASASVSETVAASPIASAAPASTTPAASTLTTGAAVPAATNMCDSFDELTVRTYTIFQNNWGASAATSGSQCTNYTGVNADGSVKWDASWSWEGGPYNVKSYANVALEGVDKAISEVTSIPTVWTWAYSGTGVSSMVADVSYDMWIAPSASADNDYEIMIWLGAYGGAGPISASGSPVDTPTIAGTPWNLFTGTNGPTTVHSFVAPAPITDFSADLLEFFTYLVTSQGVDASQVITSIQAGTEPFTGTDVVLSTSAYSVSVS